MENKAFELLQLMAARLGVASEKVWEVLVLQAYAEAIANITVVVLLGIILAFVCIKVVPKLVSPLKKLDDKAAVYTVVAIGILAYLAMSLTWVYRSILYLVNPDFFAIEYIRTFL